MSGEIYLRRVEMADRIPNRRAQRQLLHRCVGLLVVLIVPGSALEAQGTGSRYINPSSLVKPTGYTHVVIAPDGRTAYIAGQVAFDSTGQLVGGTDFRAQAERVFQNLRRALTSVGGSMGDLVKTTTFITDLKQVPVLRELRAKYLDSA